MRCASSNAFSPYRPAIEGPDDGGSATLPDAERIPYSLENDGEKKADGGEANSCGNNEVTSKLLRRGGGRLVDCLEDN